MTTTAPERLHHTPDDGDRELLNALQAGIPIVARPYAEVGAGIGMPEDEVLRRMDVLRRAAIIRQVSAIFDTRSLGYTSTLVAARYPDDRLFDAAAIVGGHPGVSHNYRRSHAFNLWFTLAVEPGARLSLEDTLEILARETGAESMRMLPTLKLFKINVQLDMTGAQGQAAKEAPKAPPKREGLPLPSPDDQRLINVLQRDLPLRSSPFDDWAAEVGLSVDQLLAGGRDLVERGYMRRFAAVLNHRRAGFGANGMAVWRVPEEDLERVGPQMAAYRSVSHCYKRPTYEDWPYSIFTMVHARSMEACEETIAAIAEETGFNDPADRAILYSTYEFKKIRLVYYAPEYREWEDLALAGKPLPQWRPAQRAA
ncbi:MAG: AsnC family transcriptional regulator [Thermoleophilia bacterium]